MTTKHYREPKPKKDSPVLGLCGIIVLLGGLYFLFMDPGESAGQIGEVINIHKAIIGQTLTICGTILIAVQWRPR